LCEDTDTMITRASGKSVTELFKSSEDYFRSWELDICRSLKNKKNHIISTGGGIINNKKIHSILAKAGLLVYLKASAETLYERVKNSTHRPLLNTSNKFETLQNLLNERNPIYEALANFTLTTDKLTINEISDTLIKHYDIPTAAP
jgi:shikimate kinase